MPTFDENPILNSPYRHPQNHWRLDKDGKPLDIIDSGRRRSIHWMPIPKSSRSQKGDPQQGKLDLEERTRSKELALQIVKHIRNEVDNWRVRPIHKKNVTYVTQKFLQKWNEGQESGGYPLFFCQKEAAETLVWLNEVAPHTAQGKRIIEQIKDANEEANPSLLRYATKMATGAGKTTVMAMMIAYHTVNKMRQPKSSRFCNHFLIITPGITIRDSRIFR